MKIVNIDKATMDLLVLLEAVKGEVPHQVTKLAAALMEAVSRIDEPDHICPLCGQAKEQTALLEILGSLKSCEMWGDDGQSWTIDVAACEGKLDAVVGLMLDVKRGTYA